MTLTPHDFLLVLERAGTVFDRRGVFRGNVLDLVERINSPASELIDVDRLRVPGEALPDLLQAAADAGLATCDRTARPLPVWTIRR